MSKARQKGTIFENFVRAELKHVWPEMERAALKGIDDYGDFINIDGWMIEARNRKTWALPEWIRGVYKRVKRKHGDTTHPWAIVFKADMRSDLNEAYATIPLWLLAELLYTSKYSERTL